MACELVWSPEALEDVEQIASYIERDSGWYTQAVVGRLFASAEALLELPLRGRVVPEMRADDLREVFVYSYRVIYRVVESQITIVAVVHGHRLIDPLMSRIGGDI